MNISPLLAWFAENGRHDLPWRIDRTPYKVWVSEIMLQQTQVKTVLEYYSRFLSAFPDVRALAEAEEETVLRQWEGLGYYRRARQLHAAAKIIAGRPGAEFPETFAEVLALPGIGRYTAGAILSFACDQRLPILEANTQRLYARLIALELPVTAADAQKRLWETAESFVSAETSSESPCAINTALMDLGNLVCTPQNPQCDVCPLRESCEAFRRGLTEKIPVPAPKMAYEARTEAALLLENARSEVCLLRYVPGEWWAGLWDFPRTQITGGAPRDELQKFTRETTGLEVEITEEAAKIRHSVTKYRILLHVFRGRLVSSANARKETPSGGEIRWVGEKELETIPLCSTGRKIAEMKRKGE